MPTTAQGFWIQPAGAPLSDVIVTGSPAFKQMIAVAPTVGDASTVTTFGTAAGNTAITVEPYVNRSSTVDSKLTLGWAINVNGTDGFGATATALRVIPAGNWAISFFVGVPQGGTGTGVVSASFTPFVYIVNSDGTQNLLFAGNTSNVISSTALAIGQGVLTSNTTVAETIVLPGQGLHLAFTANGAQSAGLVGATVNAFAQFAIQSGTQAIVFPAPGIRTRYPQTLTDTISPIVDNVSGVSLKRRTLTDTSAVTDTLSRVTQYKRTLSDASPVTDTLKSASIFNRTLTENLSAGGGTVVNNYVRPVLIFED